MPKWKIPITWEMFGEYEIEADTLAEAISLSEKEPLPDGDYVSASSGVCADLLESEYPDEDFDGGPLWDIVYGKNL